MQLINLSIRGLRPFKTEPPTEIHFSETEPIDIVGDTDALGAAFDFALYGRTRLPKSGRPRPEERRCALPSYPLDVPRQRRDVGTDPHAAPPARRPTRYSRLQPAPHRPQRRTRHDDRRCAAGR